MIVVIEAQMSLFGSFLWHGSCFVSSFSLIREGCGGVGCGGGRGGGNLAYPSSMNLWLEVIQKYSRPFMIYDTQLASPDHVF